MPQKIITKPTFVRPFPTHFSVSPFLHPLGFSVVSGFRFHVDIPYQPQNPIFKAIFTAAGPLLKPMAIREKYRQKKITGNGNQLLHCHVSEAKVHSNRRPSTLNEKLRKTQILPRRQRSTFKA